MTIRIALFNHKGGVSKTTTAFNLGWMIASKGKRVILVDTDPQCNLTGMVLGYKGPSELEKFYLEETESNIMAGLSPAFDSRPERIKAVKCIPVERQDGLFLLPGHIRLAEYEVTLGIAQELSAAIQTLKNLPGSISVLLDETAKSLDVDYVMVDMSPSLSSINQNLLMTSDFFIVPTNPDYFSVMALNSLATVIPKWHNWLLTALKLPALQSADYMLPNTIPKFLGTIVQKYRPRGGGPAKAFKKWIDEINRTVSGQLIPALSRSNMMMPPKAYQDIDIERDYCLATISDFNTLIARSHKSQTPIFALTPDQLHQKGVVLQRTLKSRDRFREVFSDLADKIIKVTYNANSC